MANVNDETKFLLACLQGAKPDYEKVVDELGGSMTAQQAYKKLWGINKKYKDGLGAGGSSAEFSPKKAKKGVVAESAGVKKRGRPPKKTKAAASESTEEEEGAKEGAKGDAE